MRKVAITLKDTAELGSDKEIERGGDVESASSKQAFGLSLLIVHRLRSRSWRERGGFAKVTYQSE